MRKGMWAAGRGGRGRARDSGRRHQQGNRRHAEHDRLGGLHPAAMGQAVREADRLHVHAKYAGSSDEMVALMRSGGGDQYDMVSASGDASLRLIYGGDVQPVDPSKIPRLQELRQGVPVAAQQHSQRQALRDLAAVGPEHAALQHQEGRCRRRRAGRRSTARSTRARSPCPTTRSRSPTSRST